MTAISSGLYADRSPAYDTEELDQTYMMDCVTLYRVTWELDVEWSDEEMSEFDDSWLLVAN